MASDKPDDQLFLPITGVLIQQPTTCAFCLVKPHGGVELVFVTEDRRVPVCGDCKAKHVGHEAYTAIAAAQLIGISKAEVLAAMENGTLQWHYRGGNALQPRVIPRAALMAWARTINMGGRESR